MLSLRFTHWGSSSAKSSGRRSGRVETIPQRENLSSQLFKAINK
jgi:hypothetical protein